jgi:hypothetical protein
MHPIEIRSIEKAVRIRFDDDKVTLPKAVRQKIDHHWGQLVQDNPRLRNGEVFTVTAVSETDDDIDVRLAETDYAHYLYSHQIGGLGEYTVRIIHSATLVVTTDSKIIFGAMGKHTSRPGIIQCCGGGIDHNDISGGVVDVDHNTVKELAEELGIDAYDKSVVEEFFPAYLKSGGPTEKMTLAYVLRLKQSGAQFLQQYKEFAEKLDDEPEFGQIFCIDADKESVERFIAQHGDNLNEYMPVLLRVAHQNVG